MPTNQTVKAQARAFAAERNVNYTTALRVVKDLHDPLSFRSFLADSQVIIRDRMAAADVKADLAGPGGRDLAAMRAHFVHEDDESVEDLIQHYRFWLGAAGIIGMIIGGGYSPRTGADWRSVALDLNFPTGNDPATLNLYLDATTASNGARAIVASHYDRVLSRIAFDDLDNLYGMALDQHETDLGPLGVVGVNPVRQLPGFIDCPGFQVRHGWVPASVGIGSKQTFIEGDTKPTPGARRAILAGWAGRKQHLYIEDPTKHTHEILTWIDGDPV